MRDQLAALLLLAIVIARSIVGDLGPRASLPRPAERPAGAAATALICALLALAITGGGDVDDGLPLGLAGMAYLLSARTAEALAHDSRWTPAAASDEERRCG